MYAGGGGGHCLEVIGALYTIENLSAEPFNPRQNDSF